MALIDLKVLDCRVGVALIDMPGRPLNVFSESLMSELEKVVERACNELEGLVITSGKHTFVAGADLVMIKDFARMRFDADRAEMKRRFSRLGRIFRCIEQSPIPIVAAINGLALGGGLELAMACHGRVCVDSESPMLGVPEIKLGLFPGAGGTQRLPRLIGVEAAIPLLLDGESVTPAVALELGLVDELAAREKLVDRAVDLALSLSPGACWDDPSWDLPAAEVQLVKSPDWPSFCLQRCHWKAGRPDLYPAVDCIIRCLSKGLPLPIDEGSDVEWDIFVDLMSGPIAANMVVTCFLNKSLVDGDAAAHCRSTIRSTLAVALSESRGDSAELSTALRAVDAGSLLKLTGSTDSRAQTTFSDQQRAAGLSVLGLLAHKVFSDTLQSYELIDAVSVLTLGWPAWTGGPVAFLAMLQREEIKNWRPDDELQELIGSIPKPLKIKADYSHMFN